MSIVLVKLMKLERLATDIGTARIAAKVGTNSAFARESIISVPRSNFKPHHVERYGTINYYGGCNTTFCSVRVNSPKKLKCHIFESRTNLIEGRDDAIPAVRS